ncbi:hypothetical protein [Commensalibacter communis]|uniref:Uncharacterized protein n=1 Tax=Commensalibacter communis TaxID=2972786 RepID=A0A9W4XAM6_9PROT|nr:hypothetical protein [Commensalibacter communis]CAI3950856.1 unnamed protein product [Commensalibacter communis]CAI3951207.1 unnamed protein product [Commensalibacter communis]CAI3955654.1 unnamed protein product [Commensalibacter communis]CAI3957560.1 unnamed protein product [Commensalibacter communis]CAI3957708.1 unnamed protein product [Commensalibacter communis]
MTDVANKNLSLVTSDNAGLVISHDAHNEMNSLTLKTDDAGLMIDTILKEDAKRTSLQSGYCVVDLNSTPQYNHYRSIVQANQARLDITFNDTPSHYYSVVNLQSLGSNLILNGSEGASDTGEVINSYQFLASAGRCSLEFSSIMSDNPSDSCSVFIGDGMQLQMMNRADDQSLQLLIQGDPVLTIDAKEGISLSGVVKVDQLVVSHKNTIETQGLLEGTQAWDPVSKKPCWWNGEQWVDATGTILI